MKLDAIDIDSTLTDVEKLLKEDKKLSPALKATISILVVLVKLLTDRVGLNSQNSSKPPSTDSDSNKKKQKKQNRSSSGKSSGGQKGHVGTTLEQTEDPDDIRVLKIDRRTLPKGDFQEAGYSIRQVFDIDITRWVTEYQAQILINKETGQQYTASFPEDITKAVQYGNKLKAHAVYMSQYQLIPYLRVKEYFTELLGIPISEGSLFNFNNAAYKKLKTFEEITIQKLIDAPILPVDETGININGEKYWLHCATNASWTYFFPIKDGAPRQLTQQAYSHSIKAYYVMTIGSLIIRIPAAYMRCVTHIT